MHSGHEAPRGSQAAEKTAAQACSTMTLSQGCAAIKSLKAVRPSASRPGMRVRARAR